ncbi:MAG: hypothetical protein WAZ19_11130 [Anaerolineae bacterium]
MKPIFYKLDFGAAFPMVANNNYIVKSLSYSAIGGCEFAEIQVVGDWNSTYSELQRIRQPVIIHDNAGNYLWWGYVADIRVGPTGVTVDGMANRVRAKYGSLFTAWYSDPVSVAIFGTKELIVEAGNVPLAQADELARATLERTKNPIAYNNSVGAEQTPIATLYCRGWWSTLDWITTPAPLLPLDSATVIADMIYPSEFIGGVMYILPTGITADYPTEGQNTRQAVEKLISYGKISPRIGLKASVTMNRRTLIAAEGDPAKPYRLTRYDEYSSPNRTPIYKPVSPIEIVGNWCTRDDGYGRINYRYGESFFISRSTYNVSGNKIDISTRGVDQGINSI